MVSAGSTVGAWTLRLVGASLVAAMFPAGARGVEIIAHRGASFDAPENTLPAVLLGWERGADAVEVDVHLTADRRVVAFHDRDTRRITGQPGLVAEITFSRLRELDAGAWKEERWRGTQIPELRDVLETVPPGKVLFVEVKGPGAMLRELERSLDDSGVRSRVVLIAFDYDTIVAAKKRMPEVPCHWLFGHSAEASETYGVRSPSDLIERVGRGGLDGLDVRHDGPWTAELARELAARGKSLYVYTVNSPETARELRDAGVTGITTDRPAHIREMLDRP